MGNITLSEYLATIRAEDGRYFNATDFFPDCILPKCDYNIDCTEHTGIIRAENHQHILPKQQQVFDSTCMHVYSQGGVGSAKTVAFAARTVALSVAIPGNEGAVCRLNFRELYKSSWKNIKLTNKRLVERGKILQPHYSAKTQGDHSQCRYSNDSLLYAIQAKNWSEGLGADYGLYWVDDSMECPIELFAGDEGSAGLISRLRAPQARFVRGVYDDHERFHGFLSGMVSTNPPFIGHWNHKLFGNKPGRHKIGDDEVEWIQVSNTENPFTGVHYSKTLVAVQVKLGKSEATIRRIVHGDSIPAYGGIPVYPQFDHHRHIAPLKFNPMLPLIRSWDFGFDHPAVLYSNIFKCKYGINHFFNLSETADAHNITVHRLYSDYVKPHTAKLYGDAKLILDCGDRAGYRSSSSNKDGRSDMKILMAEPYNLGFRWKYINLEPSLQYMRELYDPPEPCKCGLEKILISPMCKVLIGAIEGGYKYPKPKSGIVGNKPIEDKMFADIACAQRYGAENYVKWGVDWQDQRALQEEKERENKRVIQANIDNDPLAWLAMTDKQFVARLTS